MIQLLIGPYRSGKTGRLLNELVDYKREHPLDSCLILVPSQRYGSLLQKQLVELLASDDQVNNGEGRSATGNGKASRGIFGVRIATIYEACDQIVHNAGLVPNVLPRELSADVVAKALAELDSRGELNHLKSIVGMRGTCAALYKLIDEFERAALTPSDVLKAVGATGATSSRHHELAMVYKEYWLKLEELGVTDQKRLAFTAREILASGRTGSRSASANTTRMLIVDGFDRISPLQAELMLAISQHAARTLISFDYVRPEERSPSANLSEDEYSWKDSSFAELQSRFPVEPQIAAAKSSNNAPLNVSGFKAIERYFETQEIARRCKEIIRKGDTKPADILVVARDISAYAEAVRASFSDAGIPFFIDESIEHRSLPLTKFLCALFTLASEEFPRRQMMDCLRSPFFNAEGLGLNRVNIASLDKKSLEAGVLNGKTNWQNFLDKSLPEELAIKFDAFIAAVTPPGPQMVAEHARWMEDRIDQLRKPLAARAADDHSATSSPPELEALAGIRSALNTLLVHEQLFAHEPIPFAQFFSELETILDQSTVRRSPAIEQAVHICSAEHAPNRRYDCLFIAGAVEGEFPKHSGESGFLSADERSRWGMFGIQLTNPREDPGFERALFKSLIERSRKQLQISAPCVDMSGDELFISFYLTDGTLQLPSFEVIDVSQRGFLNPASAREAIGSWLWQSPGIEPPEALQGKPETALLWQTLSAPLLGAWSRHHNGTKTAYNGYLSDLISSGWMQIKAPHAWNATALNNYGQCPFKYWLTNLLGVTPRDEPEAGLTVKFKGMLFHKALELFYSAMAKVPATEHEACREDQLKVALELAVADLEKDGKFHPSPYWQNEQKELLFRLKRFVDFDTQRLEREKEPTHPALFEAKFGLFTDESHPAVTIQGDLGPINIRGVIDRIDVHKSLEDPQKISVTVIDYKTGSTPISIDDITAFAQVQLPLYAMAIQQSIMPGARVNAGNYLSVNAAKSIGSINFSNEKWSGLVESTKERIKQTVNSVTQGDFSLSPYASKACKNCDHAAVCRITEMRNLQPAEDN